MVVTQLRDHGDVNRETTQVEELSIPEEFLLLATNDKNGEPEVPAEVLRTAMAGAILAELDLLGAITLEGEHVKATEIAPETEFQRELELIGHKPLPHTPKRWVSTLASRSEVHRAYERMASRGIVEHVGEKHLGLFRSARYPEKDHGPEAALMKKIEAALRPSPPDPAPSETAQPGTAPSGAATPDARTTALIGLLEAAKLLGRLFPEADVGRARELVKNHWPSRAVEDEVRMIRLTHLNEIPPWI